MSHEEYKQLVNNRAKRVLIEKFVKHGRWKEIEGFKYLKFNDQQTNDKINLVLETQGKRVRQRKMNTKK